MTALIESNSLAPPAPGIAAQQNNSSFKPKAALSGGWNAKAGVEPVTRNSIVPQARPDPWAMPAESSGAAWASASAPELDLPVSWDKASFDARFDPTHEQSKFGAKMSKSVPLGDQLAVTLQNGYSVTHMQSMAPAAPEGMVAAPVVSGMAPPAQIFDTERSAKFSIVPTGTSFSAGGHMSTTDEKWLRSLSAEQKLFGSMNVTGTVSETPTGDLNRSLTAGFKRNW